MIGTNRNRALLVSSSVILLCMAIIFGMTWALFTDTKTVVHHLQAGDLQITLKRTELTKTTLDATGRLATTVVQTETDAPVDFTDPTDKNVFGLLVKDGNPVDKIIPGAKLVAKMKVENNSDVAFGYWIEVVCKDKTAGEALAKQLRVTVNTGTEQSALVGKGLAVKGDGGYVGVLEVGSSEEFSVTVEFLDSADESNKVSDNNGAQNQRLDFDLVVHAVQATATPTS